MKTKLFFIAFLSLVLGNANAQCSASFNFSNTGNGNVSFTSTSTGTTANTAYYWQFGDGNINWGYNTTTSHAYNNGIYTATLTIIDSLPPCGSFTTATFTVSNAPCNGTLSFSSAQQQNGLVNFTNTSPGQYYNWNWAFGDGGTSNQFSPQHTYTLSGMYNVTLTATDQLAICNFSTVQSISVTVAPCNLNASFVYTVTGGTINLQSTSTGTSPTTGFWWDYGDGNNGCCGPSSSHTYSTPGTYSVILAIADSVNFPCNSSITQTVFVNAPCITSVSFNMWKDSTQMPNIVWDAWPSYPQNIVAANWSWGDGSNTLALYPSHTYSAAGMYNICVTITVSCGATATACLNQNIFRTIAGAENMSANAVVNVLSQMPTGIKNSAKNEIEFRIFPNPNNGEFSLQASGVSESAVVSIYNLLGEKVFEKKFESSSNNLEEKINPGELSNGTYLLKLQSGQIQKNARLIITK